MHLTVLQPLFLKPNQKVTKIVRRYACLSHQLDPKPTFQNQSISKLRVRRLRPVTQIHSRLNPLTASAFFCVGISQKYVTNCSYLFCKVSFWNDIFKMQFCGWSAIKVMWRNINISRESIYSDWESNHWSEKCMDYVSIYEPFLPSLNLMFVDIFRLSFDSLALIDWKLYVISSI